MSADQAPLVSHRGIGRSVLDWFSRPMKVGLTCESLTWMAVLLGVALRLWEYFEFRQLYMDEISLLKNLVNREVLDFHHVLVDDQMAPPGFLVIERLLLRLPLGVKAAGRLFPLFCGIATVILTRTVARRYLDRRAVPIAVALLALADHLIYYSAEIKQYSCDLMFTLVTLSLAAPPAGVSGLKQRRALAVFGVIAPWFSFPVVFPLAAAGLRFIATAMREKGWKGAARTSAVCLLWAVSFGVCYRLSRSILSSRDFIWVWWNFAFLPIPPRTVGELQFLGETLANVFINPCSLLSPFSLSYTAALASILWLFGFLSIGRRWPGGLFILTAPIAFALAASALHLYPFHGRLLIYLVPSFLLPLSEGVAAIGRRTGWLATVLLAGLFLYSAAAEIAWYKAIQARSRTFDTHGDLKNDLLDYLDYQRRQPPARRAPAGAARDVAP